MLNIMYIWINWFNLIFIKKLLLRYLVIKYGETEAEEVEKISSESHSSEGQGYYTKFNVTLASILLTTVEKNSKPSFSSLGNIKYSLYPGICGLIA